MAKIPPQLLGRRASMTPGVQAAQAASKIGPVSVDRTIAQAPVPADTTGRSQNRAQVTTILTKIPTAGAEPQILYNGDRLWTRVTLTLENAGPVAVGTSRDIYPVLSGKGQLLTPGEPTPFDIAKGDVLYVAATSVNRIKITVAALPWLETITGLIGTLIARLTGSHPVASSNAPAPGATKNTKY